MTKPLTPALLLEWHPTKNGELNPLIFLDNSRKKIWWQDARGHVWQSTIFNRANGSKCPQCSGKFPIVGETDLATTHPRIAAEWHPTKNGELKATDVKAGSNKRFWWQDKFGHEWEAQPNSRTTSLSQRGCPFCSNSKILAGYNDLLFQDPELALEWHPIKNANLLPSEVTLSSHTKVWWLCQKGHSYNMTPNKRTSSKQNCPICAGKRVEVGMNDLVTTHPEIAAEWHPTKNGNNHPTLVNAGSNKKVWWKDKFGHEWETTPNHRISGKQNCAVCAGKKILLGYNDVASQEPALVLEWHPTKNKKLKPTDFTRGSNQKVWWQCPKGHEWYISIASRGHGGTNCLTCWTESYVSKPEQEIYDIIAQLGFVVEQTNRKILGKNREIDLYIPEKKFGIEFNGVYWHDENHKSKTYHYDKYVAAKDVGVQLFQIWEDDWKNRKPIILRALAHKLGVSDKFAALYPELATGTTKVAARKTTLTKVSTVEAEIFLLTNHIQGFASGSHYVGLRDSEGILRALIVLKLEAGNTLNIVRYATNGSVVGGFTKLLAFAKRMYKPPSFITFADHMVSDGGLYESNGFVMDKEIKPDYMYVVRGERKHKFGYRLKKFREDPNLLWEDGKTERELALLNGIPRVWDAGKSRYRRVVSL